MYLFRVTGKVMNEVECVVGGGGGRGDLNSNHHGALASATTTTTSTSAADRNTSSCLSNASSQDIGDFVQDNSDYQWFLDYGYRDGGVHHHASVLSSLTESYGGPDEIGYYDALSKNLDANLAEADMESFRTEDIHALLTTLPAMCTDMQLVTDVSFPHFILILIVALLKLVKFNLTRFNEFLFPNKNQAQHLLK